MNKFVINGPAKLSGRVHTQGSKNASMKHILSPLLTSQECIISNVPRIGSINVLLEILNLLNVETKWLDNNTISINARYLQNKLIPAKLFLYTSAGIHLIPLLTAKFGKCEIESDDGTYGGCRIGNRTMDEVGNLLKRIGIEWKMENNIYKFKLKGNLNKDIELGIKSFSSTVNIALAYLACNQSGIIRNCADDPEIKDIISMWKKMGATIFHEKDVIKISNYQELHGTKHMNMNDRNDLVTWTAIALATKSEIEIVFENIQNYQMEPLFQFLDSIDAKYKLNKDSLKIFERENLKPINIVAGGYPNFHTDWQPLIAPLLTQIDGQSSIQETYYPNRLRYWEQLGKLGAKYKFYKPDKDKYDDENPHAVKTFGPQNLQGNEVKALDVRAGASMIIAGLIANGQTSISNVEEIERGYENICERLENLGAEIKIKS